MYVAHHELESVIISMMMMMIMIIIVHGELTACFPSAFLKHCRQHFLQHFLNHFA